MKNYTHDFAAGVVDGAKAGITAGVICTLVILLVVAASFLFTAFCVWLGISIAHSLGFWLGVTFMWRYALAIWILLAILRSILK